MTFELIILGSSSALPTSKRFPTAHLLKVDERFFLIDCGEGTQIQLRKYGLNPARIHHIFISHLHGDHVYGLFGLLSTMGMMGRKIPLNLYGPSRLKEMMEQHLSFFGNLPFGLSFHAPDADPEVCIYEDEKLTVLPIPLTHRTTTFGYLFREKKKLLNVRKEQIEKYGIGIADVVRIKQGEDFTCSDGSVIPCSSLTLPPYQQRSYAYISDTVYDPDLLPKVQKVNLLFHEATFLDKDKKLAADTKHTTAAQAATLAKKAEVGKLLIGHFSSRYKDYELLEEEARAIFRNTHGVKDGEVYSLPPERVSTE
ncbi:MAG: ribonuclease Z [Bacteroidota bacterium]